MKNVYLLLSQGNVHRDLIRLGMMDNLLENYPNIRLVLLTQAWKAPDFLQEVRRDRVRVLRHDLYKPNRLQWRIIQLRRRVRGRFLIDVMSRMEAAFAGVPDGIEEASGSYPPDIVISTHPKMEWEWDVINWARKRGIRTAGIIKSWDNVLKKPITRADRIAVWGQANYQEALEEERYREDEVEMVGSPAFDRYFTRGVVKEREGFWRERGLDPTKPVILFGTVGGLGLDWDETFMLDLLLEFCETQPELKGAQIVCRLHPMTHLEYFLPYKEHPRVLLSHGSYVKTLGWSMTRDEVDEMANMLCHSDVVITPASTLSLEGPCFDTPTIVTFFSTLRPNLAEALARKYWLNLHFRRIQRHDMLPFAWSSEELLEMLLRSLREPGWYREGRKRLVEEFVTFVDGLSYQRIARFIGKAAGVDPQ